MKRLILTMAVFISVALSAAGDMMLVENGKSKLPVVVDKNASDATVTAAKELCLYIEKISGAKIELRTNDSVNLPENAIWVGVQPGAEKAFPELNFKFQKPEEILISCNGKNIVIAGNDKFMDGVQTEYGTANAVYTFLQKYLEVRWLWPGPLGEDIISKKTITFAPFTYQFHPVILQRQLWRGKYSGQDEVYASDWFKFQRATLFSFRFKGGHAFTKWWDKYHEQHPDYFALQPDGTRNAFPTPKDVKVCVSNPKMQKQWIDDAEKLIRETPGTIMASASPNDGASSGECICDACKAMDNPDGEIVQLYGKGGAYKNVALTDRYVKFWNIVAKGLQERFPDRNVYVGAYAYGPYMSPPVAMKLDENIVIGYVGHFPFASDEMTAKQQAEWKKWGENATQMIFRPNLFHYSGGWLALPTVPLHKNIKAFKFLSENKCVGFELDTLPLSWATQGIEFYMIAQLAYDPLQDGEALLKDYYQRGFGNAAGDIERYFTIMENVHDKILEKVKLSSGAAKEAILVYRELYTDDVMKTADEALKNAAAKVADVSDKKYAERVAFIRAGFDYVKIQVDIMNVMAKVRESKGKDIEAVKKAVKLCEKRAAFLKNSDVFAIRNSQWFYNARKLDDYMGPVSQEFLNAAGIKENPEIERKQ